MKKITIAIDGLCRTGKGTTSQGVAESMGYTYLDTGAMYRMLTLQLIREGKIDGSDEELSAIMDNCTMEFHRNSETGKQEAYLNGENVEARIRETDIALNIKAATICKPVRAKMAVLQRAFGEKGGIVADGRDMGTVVYPDAELKIFLECDLEVRVKRRWKQLQEDGKPLSYDEIREEILLRDTTDYLGVDAVNTQAKDAIVIDTTLLTPDEQIKKVIDLVESIT